MATALATLAQVKEYLGNSADNTDDALLTRLLGYACELIERSCNRTLGVTTYTEVRDGNGGKFMIFSQRPINSVTSVSISGKTIPQSTAYNIDGWFVGAPWRINLRGSAYRFDEGAGNVVVVYSAGFSTIPDDLTQAACLLTGLMYKERDRMGIDAKTVGGENIVFTKDDLPPSVVKTIENYRNYFITP